MLWVRQPTIRKDMTIDISIIGLGDMVSSPTLGTGRVVECTEKPSIRVDFNKAGLRWITEASAELLELKYVG